MTDIWKRVREVEAARREYMNAAMEGYDTNVYRPAKQLLYKECENTDGHDFRFQDIGVVPWIEWYRCSRCGLQKSVNVKE